MPQASVQFRRILTRNVALPLVLGVLSAIVFVALILYLMESARSVEKSDHILARSYALQKMDLELESSLRGFLLSGEDRFLQNFDRTRDKLTADVAGLRSLLAENPEQVRRLDQIVVLQQEWNAFAVQRIASRRANVTAGMGEQAMRGRQLKDEVRQLFDEIAATAQQLRLERTRTANSNATTSMVAFVLLMLAVGATLAWRGREDLVSLSGTFEAARADLQRQSAALQEHAWLQENRTRLSERLAREQELAAVGHAGLEALAESLGIAVAALYSGSAREGFVRRATWGWPADDGAVGERVPPERTLLSECATQRQPLALDTVPPGYLRVSSSLGAATAASVLLAPMLHEGRVVGVLELGFLRPLQSRDRQLATAAGETLGTAMEAATYRQRLQDALEETQQLNEELQVQQEELRTANEELEEQSRALKESQAHLESQQAELEQTNVQLSDQAERLEQQRDALRGAQQALEERAAELQRASRYKSEFLANMSHELRTPLNSSLILAKLLADNPEGNLNDEQVRFAQSIHSAGADLLNLINDILDISKVEAGKLEMRPEVTPVAALAEGLKSMFQPVADRKGLQLDLQVEPGVPASMYTDRQRLEQILRNLMGNAVKFTEAGHVALRVAREGTDAIVFEVRDTGIGIDASKQDLIFEAFQQADGTVSRRFGGTGLGLSISRDLAGLLGGTITLESTPGVGSTFRVVLPLEYTRPAGAPEELPRAAPLPGRVPPPPPRPRPTATPAPTPAVRAPSFDDDRATPAEGRRTLLVVEDDEPFARILYKLAHELGYRCLVAMQAEEGAELAMTDVPDAVLLDMRLPDDSGLSVLQRLKEDARTRHVPVHVISAEDRSETAMHLGAIGYALKPTTPEQLREVFDRLETKLSQKLKRVLLVEDDPRQQHSIVQLIGDGDVEIVAVAEGRQALDALEGSVFDVMVMDLQLPDMSGQELLRRMASGESRSFPPVIVYTGRNLTRDEEAELLRYSRSIIIKGARSPERLLDEVTLFLHKVETQLSSERQKMLRAARNRDKAFEGRRILVVDDDMRNIFALTSALEHKGADVEVARNGLEALDKLRQSPDGIDLVLMDIMMPEMDGYTATREIRKDPRWQKLPIIAVTAKAMKEDQQRCLDAGANDYLAKPIELDRLFSLLRVWMPKMERI